MSQYQFVPEDKGRGKIEPQSNNEDVILKTFSDEKFRFLFDKRFRRPSFSIFSDKSKQGFQKPERLNAVLLGTPKSGKSTLCGYMIANQLSREQADYYKNIADDDREQYSWCSYIMDDSEPALRGTTDVGRTFIRTNETKICILDTPGSRIYTANMFKGVAQADVGVLVLPIHQAEVNATVGRLTEILVISKTLGITKFIAVVNKMDLAEEYTADHGYQEVNWSQKCFQEIVEKVTPIFLKLGWEQEDFLFIPICASNGENVYTRVQNWWSGPSLVEVMDTIEIPQRDTNGPARIPILDHLRRVAVVEGKISSGSIKVGDYLKVVSQQVPVQVLEIYVGLHKVERAGPGDTIRVILSVDNILQGEEPWDTLSDISECSVLMSILSWMYSGDVAVLAKVETGIIRTNDDLLLLPMQEACSIMSVNTLPEDTSSAGPGVYLRARVATEVKSQVEASVMSYPDDMLLAADEFEADIQVIGAVSTMPGSRAFNHVSVGYRATLHVYTTVVDCTISKGFFTRNGDTMHCTIKTDQVICLSAFANFPHFGRFILRREGLTTAVGKVVGKFYRSFPSTSK